MCVSRREGGASDSNICLPFGIHNLKFSLHNIVYSTKMSFMYVFIYDTGSIDK